MTGAAQQFLCIYGHFYQPPREEPFSERILDEPGAVPFANFNDKITAECYRPNAEAGNFEAISFDLGPTLATWLEACHPDVHARILAADRLNVERYGVGNALAHAYNHTILPLASPRDKRTQIHWGLQDFAHRFGRPAEGMWLAETAVDLETLGLLAAEGIRYTVLAPWQSAEPIDPTESYLVRLPGAREIAVFFYNGPLSGGVSFDGDMTANADAFAATTLPSQLSPRKTERGADQLLTIASDGELYGHHKQWRDQFLTRLVREAAPAHGFEVTSLGRYLRDHPPTKTVELALPSAWSCAHNVARWDSGCSCTEGDSSWKPALRRALDRLATQLNATLEHATAVTLSDPWGARDAYLGLRRGWLTAEEFWRRYGSKGRQADTETATAHAEQLLKAQYYGQCMYTSCGFYFEDLDRIEPANDIAFARRAISLVWQATKRDLQTQFVRDLAAARSWRTGLTGADIYRRLPRVEPGLLPPSGDATDEPAA